MSRFVFIFLIASLAAQAQQTNFEQVAFNYFATEIVSQMYPDLKKIYFSGQTENEKNIGGPFSQCFEYDSDFRQLWYQPKKSESEKVTIESDNFSQLKRSPRPKSKQLNLEIYRAVVKDEMVYVYIKLYKEMHFTDHYLVKISSPNNAVVDSCHMNEIW